MDLHGLTFLQCSCREERHHTVKSECLFGSMLMCCHRHLLSPRSAACVCAYCSVSAGGLTPNYQLLWYHWFLCLLRSSAVKHKPRPPNVGPQQSQKADKMRPSYYFSDGDKKTFLFRPQMCADTLITENLLEIFSHECLIHRMLNKKRNQISKS